MTQDERQKLIVLCGHVFSPSAPINNNDLFAGRLREIRQISDAIQTRGRHVVMYGSRGVGKTSLANILKPLFKQFEGMKIVRANCADGDDFANIWKKALDEIEVIEEKAAMDGDTPIRNDRRLSYYLDENNVGPGEIRQILQRHSQDDFELVIVFDEFDRLDKSQSRAFSDTIKDLSDNSISTTLILVGVAGNVLDLIDTHESIDRCLVQIRMPIMTHEELGEIISKAMKALKMKIDPGAQELIVSLSQGLPHYTHLIAQESTYHAIDKGRKSISIEDVTEGIRVAVENTQQKVRSDYYSAVSGQRKGTLFPQVLLACALAEVDELGCFGSADLREPLCSITGKTYDIPNYSQHLDKFSTDSSRGLVLEKSGTSRRFKFKFRNPLMQPFIIMKGLTDGHITGDLINKLRAKRPSTAIKYGTLFS